MDETLSQAICVVRLDDVQVEAWFELICRTHAELVDADRVEWSHFCSLLAEGAMSAGISRVVVDQFVEHMAAHDLAPLETVGRMAESPTEPAHHYRQHAMSATALDEEPGPKYDERTWQTFLEAHGARWDGAESSWEQFRSWFLYEAEQHGFAAPANGFITYVESQRVKAEAFALYRIPLTAAEHAVDEQRTPVDPKSFPDTRHGDSGQWVEYLDVMLTHSGF